MPNIDKQTLADDESVKTYFIHPAAFGSTKNPGYGHVAVVKAEDFEKLCARLEAAEKRIAELEAREVKLPELKMLRDYLAEVTHREREDILVGVRLGFFRALEEAGVKVAAAGKGE
ncbi:hypothetical protein LMA54_07650 [Enterobacter hormaechei subsp. hoffmannii]|nr:hypothetical protein [Enterobacter hormaechei]MCC4573328.1 hypothetical protein [Enterobacter hormaechei subsp. hoffmannii]MCC4584198.1 hypothetical protein [Enterobacter hormaechei subsp. hoffmannii]